VTRVGRVALVVVAAIQLLSACSGDDDSQDSASSVAANDALCLDADRSERPVVDLITPGMAAVDDLYGEPQRYFEVSADNQRVSLIVARDDGTAEQVFYCGAAGRTSAEPLGDASGSSFPSESVQFDPETIFDGIDAELDDPEVVDMAIVGAGDDAVVYDATVRSGEGGTLLVLLGPDGAVRAVQAE
jgi:hypothetical protein